MEEQKTQQPKLPDVILKNCQKFVDGMTKKAMIRCEVEEVRTDEKK